MAGQEKLYSAANLCIIPFMANWESKLTHSPMLKTTLTIPFPIPQYYPNSEEMSDSCWLKLRNLKHILHSYIIYLKKKKVKLKHGNRPFKKMLPPSMTASLMAAVDDRERLQTIGEVILTSLGCGWCVCRVCVCVWLRDEGSSGHTKTLLTHSVEEQNLSAVND